MTEEIKTTEQQIAEIKKEIEKHEIPIFGKQINMGGITMEEYNNIVKYFGNRFININTGDILCPCGKFHPIEKTKKGKKIMCPTIGFKVSAYTNPKLYELWIRRIIEFYNELECYLKTKNLESKND